MSPPHDRQDEPPSGETERAGRQALADELYDCAVHSRP
jgi:hypothetical protein